MINYTIVNRPAVKNDIISITEYYNAISSDLAKQFLFRIREAKTSIAHSPRGFQIKYNKVRTLLLKQFPYHIHYLIDNKQKQIVILAIIHAYKNPTDFSIR